MSEVITVNLKIWRQEGPDKEGHFEEHAQKITTEASFLEMIDVLNEDLNNKEVTILGTGKPTKGSHNKPILFLHPKEFCGTLIELEEE